jgi:hypothetical protein
MFPELPGADPLVRDRILLHRRDGSDTICVRPRDSVSSRIEHELLHDDDFGLRGQRTGLRLDNADCLSASIYSNDHYRRCCRRFGVIATWRRCVANARILSGEYVVETVRWSLGITHFGVSVLRMCV